MPRYGVNTERKYKPVDAGMHGAWLIHMIDLGTHLEDTGKYGHKEQRKARFTWALPDCLTDDGRPMVISTTMTLSSHEKANFRKMCASWTSRAFTDFEFFNWDETELFGLPCNLNVAHKPLDDGSTIAIVQSVIPIMRGQNVPQLPADTVYINLSLEPERFDVNEYTKLDGLTERTATALKGKITTSKEWQRLMAGGDQPQEGDREWHTDDPLPVEDENPAPPAHRAPPQQAQRPAPVQQQRPTAQASPPAQRPAAAPVQQRPASPVPPQARAQSQAPMAPRGQPAPARPAPGPTSNSQRAVANGRPLAARQPAAFVDPDLDQEIPF